jgi:hypothetical protein
MTAQVLALGVVQERLHVRCQRVTGVRVEPPPQGPPLGGNEQPLSG